VHLAIATNQGGVAFGYFRYVDILQALDEMCEQVPFPGKSLFMCAAHPKGTIEAFKRDDDRRKPGPGMLVEAMQRFQTEPHRVLMVGDRDEDRQADENAGCHFTYADEFFGDEE